MYTCLLICIHKYVNTHYVQVVKYCGCMCWDASPPNKQSPPGLFIFLGSENPEQKSINVNHHLLLESGRGSIPYGVTNIYNLQPWDLTWDTQKTIQFETRYGQQIIMLAIHYNNSCCGKFAILETNPSSRGFVLHFADFYSLPNLNYSYKMVSAHLKIASQTNVSCPQVGVKTTKVYWNHHLVNNHIFGIHISHQRLSNLARCTALEVPTATTASGPTWANGLDSSTGASLTYPLPRK